MEDEFQGKIEPIEVTGPYAVSVDTRLRDYVFDQKGVSRFVSRSQPQAWVKAFVLLGPSAAHAGGNKARGEPVQGGGGHPQ